MAKGGVPEQSKGGNLEKGYFLGNFLVGRPLCCLLYISLAGSLDRARFYPTTNRKEHLCQPNSRGSRTNILERNGMVNYARDAFKDLVRIQGIWILNLHPFFPRERERERERERKERRCLHCFVRPSPSSSFFFFFFFFATRTALYCNSRYQRPFLSFFFLSLSSLKNHFPSNLISPLLKNNYHTLSLETIEYTVTVLLWNNRGISSLSGITSSLTRFLVLKFEWNLAHVVRNILKYHSTIRSDHRHYTERDFKVFRMNLGKTYVGTNSQRTQDHL